MWSREASTSRCPLPEVVLCTAYSPKIRYKSWKHSELLAWISDWDLSWPVLSLRNLPEVFFFSSSFLVLCDLTKYSQNKDTYQRLSRALGVQRRQGGVHLRQQWERQNKDSSMTQIKPDSSFCFFGLRKPMLPRCIRLTHLNFNPFLYVRDVGKVAHCGQTGQTEIKHLKAKERHHVSRLSLQNKTLDNQQHGTGTSCSGGKSMSVVPDTYPYSPVNQ